MSKTVLISIRPEWCKKILDGEKTVEVRRTCPVHGTPFKAYIYCTRTASKEFILDDDNWDVSAKKHGGWPGKRGHVIGEFACKKITGLTHVGETGSWEPASLYVMAPGSYYKPADELLKAACMSKETAEKYLKGRDGCGWHISDLKIYDKPRDLDEFSRFGFWGMNGTGVCGNYGCKNYEPSDSYMIPPTCKINGCSIYRPPQSWCYVEDFCA
jgi:predicted transcriptional regulator